MVFCVSAGSCSGHEDPLQVAAPCHQLVSLRALVSQRPSRGLVSARVARTRSRGRVVWQITQGSARVCHTKSSPSKHRVNQSRKKGEKSLYKNPNHACNCICKDLVWVCAEFPWGDFFFLFYFAAAAQIRWILVKWSRKGSGLPVPLCHQPGTQAGTGNTSLLLLSATKSELELFTLD